MCVRMCVLTSTRSPSLFSPFSSPSLSLPPPLPPFLSLPLSFPLFLPPPPPPPAPLSYPDQSSLQSPVMSAIQIRSSSFRALYDRYIIIHVHEIHVYSTLVVSCTGREERKPRPNIPHPNSTNMYTQDTWVLSLEKLGQWVKDLSCRGNK